VNVAGAPPREKHRPHRIHGPQTVTEIMATGAAGGLLLLLAFTTLPALRDRFGPSPGAAGLARGPHREAPSAVSEYHGERHLLFPVPAVSPGAMSDSFAERRGTRTHLAVDILAPRGSAVVAVDDGTVARLSSSPAGGNSIYQFDVAERYCFFYAHLERYAVGLAEGQPVERGRVLGYVGTTGNAPANTPHLHFGISEVTIPKQWWGGNPIDPYPLWKAVEKEDER
jgi:murein DD-endopeptidase MepM/ murein hydrolase activator NlpD